jgi:hypothetical protein
MGILTLGLLGVAALFPVGSFYMQKAEIADHGSAIAQHAMNELVSSGMLNPNSWWMMTPPAYYKGGTSTTFNADVEYLPIQSGMAIPGTYTRPVGAALAESLVAAASSPDKAIVSKQFGAAYVIDPMGVAAMASPNNRFGQLSWNEPSAVCPSSAYAWAVVPDPSYAWSPWGSMWPVRRVTFRQPIFNPASDPWQMDAETARHYFGLPDDLATTFPPRADRPAAQNWDTTTLNQEKIVTTRQWAGDYSWLATVVPQTTEARDGLARGGYDYLVSVVVFYKRPLPPGAVSTINSMAVFGGAAKDYFKTMTAGERAVKAQVISTGLNGGELLLTDIEVKSGDSNPDSPFDQLKVGEWAMLCGPHPSSTSDEPVFFLNWYQVIAVDAEAPELDPNPNKRRNQRVVTLRGPQWPWKPPTSANDPVATLCLGIFRGAVAVHSKSLQLESSSVAPPFAANGGVVTSPPSRNWFQ